MKLKIYIDTKLHTAETDIYLVGEKADGSRSFAEPVILVFKERGMSQTVLPTFRFQQPMAQEFLPALAAALVEAGYRDAIRNDDIGELKATKAHLEDMRSFAEALATKALGQRTSLTKSEDETT